MKPLIPDVRKWFAELDRLSSGLFMHEGVKKGRKQPVTPRRTVFRRDRDLVKIVRGGFGASDE